MSVDLSRRDATRTPDHRLVYAGDPCLQSLRPSWPEICLMLGDIFLQAPLGNSIVCLNEQSLFSYIAVYQCFNNFTTLAHLFQEAFNALLSTPRSQTQNRTKTKCLLGMGSTGFRPERSGGSVVSRTARLYTSLSHEFLSRVFTTSMS
jgi:hypothetical protein